MDISTGDRRKAKDVNEVMRQRTVRRWPWVVSMLLGIVGVAAAVLRKRRLPRLEPEWLAIRPDERSTGQYLDQVTTGRSPTGNGIVRAQRPSAGTD
jgi:hypothetical protein